MAQIGTPFYLVNLNRGMVVLADSAPSGHPTAGPAVPSFARILGIPDTANRRLRDAVELAIEERKSTVMLAGSNPETRLLITIRPSVEIGRAVVQTEHLDGGASHLDWRQLVELFSVTRAEAEIAIALLRGEQLIDIALRRGVQHETVRGQVKDLLRRMGVSSQKQMTAVLSQVGSAFSAAGMDSAFEDPDHSPAHGN